LAQGRTFREIRLVHRYNWLPSDAFSAAIMQVLLLSRDKEISTVIGKAVASAGHGCQPLPQPEDIQERLQSQQGDALIIDADCLPDVAPLVTWIREQLPPSFPVLACVSPARPHSLPPLLQQGSTDYLIKPLRQHELALRLRVALQLAYPD